MQHDGATVDDDARWAAVLARDAAFDGRLVYAVSSTGIYCRPSCPARRPLRRHVRFFTGAAAARAAGFRACRRCRPDAAAAPVDAAVVRALAYLDEHAPREVSLDELGAALGLSPFHLQRCFLRCTGLTPREYVAALRLHGFRRHVRAGVGVTRAGYDAGFGSSRGLYAGARVGLGMTPGRYARAGRGLRVGWRLATCALGRVLVAATERGLCAVLLGDDDEVLVAELRRELGAACLVSGEVPPAWVEAVVRHIDDVRVPLGVALDARGTSWQLRVWDALRRIPAGERRSYGQLAASLDARGAARAVAAACAANVLAVVVPCHRVVRADGAPGGYRWGAARKAELLARESTRAGPEPR